MPCLDPQRGYRSRHVNPSGKRSIVYNLKEAYSDLPIIHPCGQCRWCRLEKSRQWAIRCVHEAQLHENNCFLTLTYAPDFEPAHRSLEKSHIVKFNKRLNTYLGGGLRTYYCGEYGEKNARPHYHVLAFNCHFPDRYEHKHKNSHHTPLYRSDALEALWPFGFCTIGAVTFESSAYVARYILKKQTGKKAFDHYHTVDARGEIIAERVPEFPGMSRRPGIGRKWFEQYKSDVFPSDAVVLRGLTMRPPKYYDNLYDQFEPDAAKQLKIKRTKLALKRQSDNTDPRQPDEIRRCQSKILDAKMSKLTRSYENET